MTSPVYKLTFLGGNTRDINEGVSRINCILEKKPVPEPEHPQVPAAYGVEFAMCRSLMKIQSKEHGRKPCMMSVLSHHKGKLLLL